MSAGRDCQGPPRLLLSLNRVPVRRSSVTEHFPLTVRIRGAQRVFNISAGRLIPQDAKGSFSKHGLRRLKGSYDQVVPPLPSFRRRSESVKSPCPRLATGGEPSEVDSELKRGPVRGILLPWLSPARSSGRPTRKKD